MLAIEELQLFVTVCHTGSITAAGRQLGLSAAVASASLKRLEKQLQVQLLERSTRSLRVTAAGEEFLGYCQQSLEVLQAGVTALRHKRETISGDIHLGAPSDLGRDALDDILENFRRQHPQVRLLIHLSDGLQDLYRNPIDLVLRYGVLRDSNLVARKLCDNDRVMCASPEYLRRCGHPDSPHALTAHNCLCFYRNGELFDRWHWMSNARTHEVCVKGDRVASDGALVRKWALAGHGIAYKSRLEVHADLCAGRLLDLFPQMQTDPLPLYALYPSRRYQPARLQALLEHLGRAFAGSGLA